PPIQLIRRLNQIDPGRIYGYYVVGLGGNFRSLMWDLGWGVPVQSQEEWLSYWSKNREKVEPFFPQEFALVRLGANMVRMDRKFGGSAIVEQMARYAGEEAYRRFDPETMAESYAPDAKQVWTKRGFQNEPNSTFFYMVKDYLYTRVFPAWRVAGFAGALLHVDGHPQNLVLDGQVSPLAKTLAKISAELYFFLGGPENDYVCKGHIFYAGETINKSAILVNDSPGDVTVAVSWWLQDEKGKTFCFRTEKLSVPQGKTGFLPITFQAPEVKEKTELKLMASWKEPTGQEHQAEPLLLRVYPRENFVWREGEIAVVDATGATLKILQEMKIPAVSLTRDKAEQNLSLLKRVRLLVVGRQSYPLAVQIINPEAMMSALREGLNVVVLEQLNRYVCGLKLENTGSREVFIRAKDSPLFAGLDNHDFSNWRGESTLLPAYPSFDSESLWWYASYSYQGQMNAWRQRRAWHWSNKGTVATFCFEKPQQGNFRVLADAGFDLLYAAAVEFSVGRGRLLLSQLDLTDRYGKDPVATRWFQRLLSEYTSLKSGVRTPVGVLSEPSLKVMEDFGLETSEGLNTAVAYLSADDLKKLSHQQVNSVKQFVTAGGSLLTYFETPEQAAKLPVKLKYEPRKIFNPDLPEHPVFSGLGRSEVFLREPHQMQAITGAEDTRVVSSSSGLAAVCQAGKGLVVILQVPPDKGKSTPEGWSRPKVRRLYATVLSNLGASSRIIPDWAAIGGWGQVEEWLPGYAERVPKKAPRVKESPFYPEPGLDWDPDAHVAF
ncbi:MAG TPA: hypothetical protein PKX93_07710, partial [bacterium]|nr:hypothetical protein [bacterium]